MASKVFTHSAVDFGGRGSIHLRTPDLHDFSDLVQSPPNWRLRWMLFVAALLIMVRFVS